LIKNLWRIKNFVSSFDKFKIMLFFINIIMFYLSFIEKWESSSWNLVVLSISVVTISCILQKNGNSLWSFTKIKRIYLKFQGKKPRWHTKILITVIMKLSLSFGRFDQEILFLIKIFKSIILKRLKFKKCSDEKIMLGEDNNSLENI
jgi:hypothetical protein